MPVMPDTKSGKIEFADGGSCKIRSQFDGKGAATRKIGPLPCVGEQR